MQGKNSSCQGCSWLLVPGLAGSLEFPSPDAQCGWLYNHCLTAVDINRLAQSF